MSQDENDPYAYELEYAFEILEPEEGDDSVTLICHPSRKLSLDEYIEALREFLTTFEVEGIMREARDPNGLLN